MTAPRRTFAGLLAFVVISNPVCAQEALSRAVELPGHRALLRTMGGIESPSPFATDGCSGGMSSAWQVVSRNFPDFAEAHGDIPPWEACCVTHDRAYHDASGATTAEASYDARKAADITLRACVKATAETDRDAIAEHYKTTPEAIDEAYALIATAMFTAVRLGGGPCTGLPWRWGYGYPGCIAGPGDFGSE
ncbi:MAG: hypothetical protein AAGF74_01290 [Pseudomonadota bacterium]